MFLATPQGLKNMGRESFALCGVEPMLQRNLVAYWCTGSRSTSVRTTAGPSLDS